MASGAGMARGALAAAALVGVACAAPAAAAPTPAGDAPGSVAVVQPLPGQGALRLNAALGRLGRNPRDVAALIDAGNAALAIGDAEAANGFFKRAEQVSPDNPAALAGLAGAMVRGDDPIGAIAMFDRAERAGASPASLASDRGLAYDLVGDAARAQRYYRAALAAAPDPEATRRLALSQAIAGERVSAEATLLPLLRAQDKAAWRARVFMLAIVGQPDDAASYAARLLPPDLAGALTPYLRYMTRLTRAQQVAAANFGVFPRAADIGRDDPRIARYAGGGLITPTPRLAANAGLLPAGAPLGRRPEGEVRSDKQARAAELASRVAPPDPLPGRQSDFTPPAAAPAPPVGPPAPPARAAAARRSMADAFADLGAPSPSAAPTAGAVDVTRLAAAKPAPAKPPPPSQPSRIWVQVGVGRDPAALLWDWRRLAREAPDAMKDRKPFTSEWGQTSRMLTGPFESPAAAADFAAQLRKQGVAGPFAWVSPAGQVVDSLPER